uniref:nostrin-like n=1 Tax=Styela clava TaxID=7725 RepID=UPI00193AD50B|nr:nostrin-like [Styela clava]
MSEFINSFMGHVGFDELKKHCKQGDDFCKEILAIMGERASAELAYAKSVKRLSQRLNKACSSLIGSPLSTLWKSICSEMEIHSDAHRKFSASLLEDCVKPSVSNVENQTKLRKALELTVESTSKTLADRIMEHSKLKKRHHQLSKEKEAICDQLEGARPKTKNDETKLAQKQTKNDLLSSRTDEEYYESLLELQRKQNEWENASKNFCVRVQDLERNKLDLSCRVAMSYSSLISNISQQLSTSCEQVKKNTANLDPEGEIRIVVQHRKSSSYQSEQQLCSYFAENFSNRIKAGRRVSGLTKPLEKFLGDLQKERAHYDGMQRLMDAQSSRSTEDEKTEMRQKLSAISSMITFLDVNRSKLQKAISTVNGSSVDPHPLAGSIENHYDKQGIMHSTLKLPYDGMNDDIVFSSSNGYNPVQTQNYPKQRSQSDNIHSTDDIGIMRSAVAPKSKSFNRGGTLTAKQMQNLSYGMSNNNNRKQAPAPPPQNSTGHMPSARCIAKYRYDSRQSDELTIEEGDVINIHDKCDADWWKGEINGNVGIFPATYVDIMP